MLVEMVTTTVTRIISTRLLIFVVISPTVQINAGLRPSSSGHDVAALPFQTGRRFEGRDLGAAVGRAPSRVGRHHQKHQKEPRHVQKCPLLRATRNRQNTLCQGNYDVFFSSSSCLYRFCVFFLDAPSHLYKRSCPSVGRSVPCYFRR